MSIVIKFHRLFEIKIIHEYFLLHDNNLTYFDLPLHQQKERLERRLLQGQYRLMNDLFIEPTAECAKILRNYRLKMAQTPTGMILASVGKVKILPDNTEILVPEIPLSPNLEFVFNIKVRNAYFRNYSSLPFRSPSNGSYFFSNDPGNVTDSGFISLSQPVETFQPNKPYLPADLANHGGVLRESLANTDNSNFWEDIESSGYVNENDRRLYPKTFMYFPRAEELNNPIVFILKEANNTNTEIKRISFENPLKSGLRVNFSTVNINGSAVPLPDGRYKLEIDNSIASLEKEIYLLSEFSQGDFGLISIRAGETNANYRILEAEGALIRPHPVFQIRLRSRRTFWRYQAKQTDKRLEPNGMAHFFNDDQNNGVQNMQPYPFLVTKKPQKLANLPVQIMDGVGALEVFPQPGPTPMKTKRMEDVAPTEPPGRVYSDVYISTINGKIGIVN